MRCRKWNIPSVMCECEDEDTSSLRCRTILINCSVLQFFITLWAFVSREAKIYSDNDGSKEAWCPSLLFLKYAVDVTSYRDQNCISCLSSCSSVNNYFYFGDWTTSRIRWFRNRKHLTALSTSLGTSCPALHYSRQVWLDFLHCLMPRLSYYLSAAQREQLLQFYS